MPPARSLKLAALLAAGLAAMAGLAAAGDPPAAPAVARFAPREDLEPLLEKYVAGLEKALASSDQFAEAVSLVTRDANTAAVLIVALGLGDQPPPGKPQAARALAAAQQLAQCEEHAAALAALEQLKRALAGDAAEPAAAAELTWDQPAAMGELMKQVSLVHTRLRRTVKSARFESSADENARTSTLLAVIAQAVQSDTNHVPEPEQEADWYARCAAMRDAAAELRSALVERRRGDAEEALDRLEQSCQDCHRQFRPDLP